jgi:hypothetical protein
MFCRSWKFGVFLLLLASQLAAGTISIQYSVTPLGGNVYEYVYSVYNNGTLPGNGSVQLFDIDFDTSLYSALQISTPSSFNLQWSQEILAGGLGYPAEFDVCAAPASSPSCPPFSGSGIPVYSTLAGFSVTFDWLGSGTPGPQPFEVYDSNFNKLQSGETATPEPSSLCLIALAFSLTACRIRLRRSKPTPSRR